MPRLEPRTVLAEALGLAEIVSVLVEIADEAIARAATQVAAALIPVAVPDEGGRRWALATDSLGIEVANQRTGIDVHD